MIFQAIVCLYWPGDYGGDTTDQRHHRSTTKVGRACSLQNEPKSTHKKRKHPFHSRINPTWCQQSWQKEPNGKQMSQASQSKWAYANHVWRREKKQITLLANAPNSVDHKTTFVRSSPRRRRRSKQSHASARRTINSHVILMYTWMMNKTWQE